MGYSLLWGGLVNVTLGLKGEGGAGGNFVSSPNL